MMWRNSHDRIIIRGAIKHIRLVTRSRIIVENEAIQIR